MSKTKANIEDVITSLFHQIAEFKVIPEKSALVLVNFLDYRSFFVKTAVKEGIPEAEVNEALNDFDLRTRQAARNAGRLLRTCREKGLEIVHVISASATGEKEESADVNKRAGLKVPSEEEGLTIYESVKPSKGELVFSHAGGEAFTDTRLDFVLRNMRVDRLILCGLMIDQSVLLSTIQAVNRGYKVMLIEDACSTFTQETHRAFVKWYKTFVNVKTMEQVLDLIEKSGH